MSYEGAPAPNLLGRINFTLTSHGWSDVTSLDNVSRINQRCEVEADNIHLQFGFIRMLDSRRERPI